MLLFFSVARKKNTVRDDDIIFYCEHFWLQIVQITPHTNKHILSDIVTAKTVEKDAPTVQNHMRNNFGTHPLAEKGPDFLKERFFHSENPVEKMDYIVSNISRASACFLVYVS